MDNVFVIKRNPLLSVWFLFLSLILWCKMFWGKALFEENSILITSILVGLFLIIVPLHYLTHKILVGKDHFRYRTLLSKKDIYYKDINSMYFQLVKQHSMNDNDTNRFHSIVFQLNNGDTFKIPYHFLVGKNRGTVLVNKAISANSEILLDEEVEKIKNNDPIYSLHISRILIFVFSNLAILFAISIVP